MSLLSLDDFLEKSKDPNFFPANHYVDEPGFQELYVRSSYSKCVNCMIYRGHWIDLARIYAISPNNGAFTNLIKKLRSKKYISIYVESVITDRFASKLLSMGFKESVSLGIISLSSFYLLSTDKVKYE